MKKITSTLALSAFMAANVNASMLSEEGWTFSPAIDVTGGFFMNDHLRQFASGREHQLKLSNAILSMSLEKDHFRAQIEGVLINDEISIDGTDRMEIDVYRNSGTDLYYYGDNPAREIYLGEFYDNYYWRVGRLITLNGERPEEKRFLTVQEAPHAVIFNTGIMNGGQAGISLFDQMLSIEAGILWGRDRPCLDGQCYLGGRLDINEKGNNTPAAEVKVTFAPNDYVSTYAYGFYNKTGSAVGSFGSGKHNDHRYALGANLKFFDNQYAALKTDIEYNRFVIGLTEDGAQGLGTPLESYDISRDGYNATINLDIKPMQTQLQISHEVLDRADERAFRDIAKFDRNHPVMSETENRTIVSVNFKSKIGFNVRAYYRMDDVPMLPNGDVLEDRAGILFQFTKEL